MEKSEDKKLRTGGRIWRRVAKTLLVTICVIMALFLLLVWGSVWILTPERLTPVARKFASEYLAADVSLQRVELSFSRGFPQLTLTVDSLDLKCRDVPQEYENLFSVRRVEGTVNILALLKYSVELQDVVVSQPKALIAVLPDGKTNFDIIPSSDEKEESSVMPPPAIAFNRFIIEDAGPLRYISVPDSTDVCLNLLNIRTEGHSQPEYRIEFSSGSSIRVGNIALDSLAIGFDGNIKYDFAAPEKLALKNIILSADSLRLDMDAEMEMRGDTLVIEKLRFEMPEWSVPQLLSLAPGIPESIRKDVVTDMRFTLSGELQSPYIYPLVTDSAVGVTPVPNAVLRLDIPRCGASWKRLVLNRIELSAEAVTKGGDLDKTEIDISRIVLSGRNVGIGLKGKLRTPLSNPAFNGTVKGGINLTGLPDILYSKFAKKITGSLRTDISFKGSAADFRPERFHRLKIKGDVNLTDLSFVSTDSLTTALTGNSTLHFGSNYKFVKRDGQVADSLLSVSVKGDTLFFHTGSTRISLSDFKIGAGTKVISQNVDSAIIPLGGVIEFKRMRLSDSVDSLLFAMRDARCVASVTRYASDRHKPLVRLVFDNRFMFGGTPAGTVGLSGTHFDVTASYRERRMRGDSIRGRRRMMSENSDAGTETLDMEVDSGVRRIFDKWSITGHLKANRGKAFMRKLGAENIIRDVSLRFSTDSIILDSLYYRIGRSDFRVKGLVANLRRALTRKRNNTLTISLNLKSDTLDVNYLSALALKGGGGDISGVIMDEDEAERATISNVTASAAVNTDSVPSKPVLIPSNLDCVLRLKAKNLIYTDFVFTDFRGDARILNSTAQLRNLAAASAAGRLNLTALYSAPSPDSIRFAMGMNVKKFQIEKMINLIPAIDSLLPTIKDFSGIINADLAATCEIDSTMNIDIPSLSAALKLSGDSLVLIDADTFSSLSKWLMFKNKKHNMIDKMEVEMAVENGVLEIYPFIFDIDRYRLGVMGSNDLAMNLNYHISVLKSPLPFKFGINIKGNVDNMNIRLGGAKFKDNKMVGERVAIADTARINLVRQIENIFRRSARSGLRLEKPRVKSEILSTDEASDTLGVSQLQQLESHEEK